MPISNTRFLKLTNNISHSGLVQPVWEKVQYENSFAHRDPACAQDGDDPLQRVDIQVFAFEGDDGDDVDVDDHKDPARAEDGDDPLQWVDIQVVAFDVDGSKNPVVLNPTISIVVFGMTDLIGIVMGESCTFGIC